MTERMGADVLGAIRACPLWSAATDAAMARLADAAQVARVQAGGTLAVEGEPAARFGVVVSGRVRSFYLGADGRRITLEEMRAGQPFAAFAALANGRNPANIEAVAPSVVAWLEPEALYALLAEEPDVVRCVIRNLATRIVCSLSVVHTLALDVPSRLARFLFQRALSGSTVAEDGLHITLGMTKAELAAALGTVPETLSRAFARLRDQGILEVRGRAVIVHDVGALARLGSGAEKS